VVRWLVLRYRETEIRDGLLQALLRRAGPARGDGSDEAVVFEPEMRVEGPLGTGPWRRLDGGGEGRTTDAPAAVRLPLLQFFPLDEVRRRAEESSAAVAPTSDESGFHLAVRVPAGPLEKVVRRARRRNLAVGFGVLAVLGAASVALVTLARRAERLANERLRFVAGVTHELRTPVASIRSLADNLADGLVGDPERLRAYGGQIRREAERLGDLVEDTLLVGGLRAAASAQDREAVSLADATRAALHGLAHRLQSHGVRVETHWDEGAVVRGRRAAIERAVANLIENAAKFSPAGGTIRVTTQGRREGRHGGRAEASVQVSDEGPGFADDERSSVLEPFFRGREAIARSLPGSGLGLAVVKETATALGGRVEISSGPRGNVTLILPLAASGEAT
jgi:signal transduction histidine kinase